MYRTTEIHEKDLGRLGLTQEDLNAYLTYNYGDEFELEKRKDVYIVSAPGEVELGDVPGFKRAAARLADKRAAEAAANAKTNAGGQ